MVREMNSFPKVLSGIIESFNDESRRSIAIAIYESEEISWSELKRKFEIQNGSLNYHLKALQKTGLVENVLSFVEGREHSVYKPTNLLAKTLKAFRDIITPDTFKEAPTRRHRPLLDSTRNSYYSRRSFNTTTLFLNQSVLNIIANLKEEDRQKKVPKPVGDILVPA